MWVFITGRHLNLPLVLATQLSRRGGDRRPRSPILGTHLITALAQSYGVPLGTLQSVAPHRLAPQHMKNSGVVHKVGNRWVVGPAPPAPDAGDDAGAAAAAAAPQPRMPRVRAPRGPPAPEVPHPPPPPVDQLTAHFDCFHARFDTFEHRMEVDQQWNAGMLTGLYRYHDIPIPDGYEYPYSYYPHPPFFHPPGAPQ